MSFYSYTKDVSYLPPYISCSTSLGIIRVSTTGDTARTPNRDSLVLVCMVQSDLAIKWNVPQIDLFSWFSFCTALIFSGEMFSVLSDAASMLSSGRLNLSSPLNKYGLLANSKLQLREKAGRYYSLGVLAYTQHLCQTLIQHLNCQHICTWR